MLLDRVTYTLLILNDLGRRLDNFESCRVLIVAYDGMLIACRLNFQLTLFIEMVYLFLNNVALKYLFHCRESLRLNMVMGLIIACGRLRACVGFYRSGGCA